MHLLIGVERTFGQIFCDKKWCGRKIGVVGYEGNAILSDFRVCRQEHVSSVSEFRDNEIPLSLIINRLVEIDEEKMKNNGGFFKKTRRGGREKCGKNAGNSKMSSEDNSKISEIYANTLVSEIVDDVSEYVASDSYEAQLEIGSDIVVLPPFNVLNDRIWNDESFDKNGWEKIEEL